MKIKRAIKAVILILIALFLAVMVLSFAKGKFGNVAVIEIGGVIATEGSDSIFSGQITSSEEIVNEIKKANKDEDIKAILFKINSPGGSAVASAEIAEAIKKVNKTTVALVREIGTSGAYWAASACDKIVAHPLSMTGSIGVIGSYLEFSGLLERYNVTYERLISGKYKDMGTSLKELTPEERQIMQSTMDQIREYFVNEVAKNRGMSVSKVNEIATGRFYLGSEAKELGLIDVLGGEDEALQLIKQEANITELKLVKYEKPKGLFSMFAGVLSNKNIGVEQGIKITT
jgi:protease-4